VTNCCSNCFTDEYLVSVIRQNGVKAECCLCGKQQRYCLGIDILKGMFAPLVSLYSNVVEYMPMEMLKEGGHPTLADKLVDDWSVFEGSTVARKFLSACCEPYHPKHNPGLDKFDPDQPVGVEELFFDIDYHESGRLRELWDALRAELATSNRFFAGKSIISGLETTLPNAVLSLPAATVFYRARASKANKPHPVGS
jgi:hypothetical protein